MGGYRHSHGFGWQPSVSEHFTQTILSQNYPRDFGKVRIGLYFCHIIATMDAETQKTSEDSFLDFQCGDLATKPPLRLHKSLLNACHINSSCKSPNSRPALMSTWNYTEGNFCRRCTLPPTSKTKILYGVHLKIYVRIYIIYSYYIFLHITYSYNNIISASYYIIYLINIWCVTYYMVYHIIYAMCQLIAYII